MGANSKSWVSVKTGRVSSESDETSIYVDCHKKDLPEILQSILIDLGYPSERTKGLNIDTFLSDLQEFEIWSGATRLVFYLDSLDIQNDRLRMFVSALCDWAGEVESRGYRVAVKI